MLRHEEVNAARQYFPKIVLAMSKLYCGHLSEMLNSLLFSNEISLVLIGKQPYGPNRFTTAIQRLMTTLGWESKPHSFEWQHT